MRITLQAEDSAARKGVKQEKVVMEAQTANGDAGDPAASEDATQEDLRRDEGDGAISNPGNGEGDGAISNPGNDEGDGAISDPGNH